MAKNNLIIGSHVSYSAKNFASKKPYLLGSLFESLSYQANAFMIYLGAPQTTRRVDVAKMELENFKLECKKNKFDSKNVIVHAPYIINLASVDEYKRQFGVDFLAKEMHMMDKLNLKTIVIHPGSSVNSTLNHGLKQLVKSLNDLYKIAPKSVNVAIETMAGKGNEVCFKFEQIEYILKHIDAEIFDNINVCLDTCHINDAGYDLDISNHDKLIAEIDKYIGLKKITVIHLNDSKNPIGAHKDRHANIGLGFIGQQNLIKFILRSEFKNVINILETPFLNGQAPYKREIAIFVDAQKNEQ